MNGLLSRWPVVCEVDGEQPVVDHGGLHTSTAILALVTSGPIWARMPKGNIEQLAAGDLLISHEPGAFGLSATIPQEASVDHVPAWPSDATQPPAAIFVRLESLANSFSSQLMPPPFVVRATNATVKKLGAALVATVQADAAAAISNATANALYLNSLHEQLQLRPRDVQVLAGLFDPEVGSVVAAILDSPARDWTVETLADVGGMSRSAFARKFRDVMGLAPIDFLVEIRMWQAARRLKQQTRDLKSIALEAGYQSPAAFSVAFKRWSGETPSDFRRGT
ncbi:MAG TPA: AraC family transcriptional regulator [Caulifigura sp.]|nr:AraC family transcriptional regulator [Caulifigura sp.]